MSRWVRQLSAIDSHTEGMPTRVVISGVEPFPGETMVARREWFIEHADDLRRFLVDEPRGHGAMSGAILQPPTRPDADWGVLFVEVPGIGGVHYDMAYGGNFYAIVAADELGLEIMPKREAIVPEITGRAWVTGTAEYVLGPDDPFPSGFVLGV